VNVLSTRIVSRFVVNIENRIGKNNESAGMDYRRIDGRRGCADPDSAAK